MFSAVIDRPVGFKDSFGNVYPINYGYIPELMGGDGEEQDVYIVSHDQQQPLEKFTGKLVAIIHRRDSQPYRIPDCPQGFQWYDLICRGTWHRHQCSLRRSHPSHRPSLV